jgi:hypothetical protein
MVPQVSKLVSRYGIKVWSGRGYDSVSLKKEFADMISERDVPTVGLHIGDFDDHGMKIYNALVEDVEAFTTGEFIPHRLAVTEEQIERLGLPSFENAVQAEAIPPDVLAQIVRDGVLQYYDEDVAYGIQVREGAERIRVDNLLAELRERVDLPED